MSMRALLATAWSALILAACWIPSSYIEPDIEPGGFSLGELQVDKLVHLGVFAVLSYLVMGAPRARRAVPWAIGVSSALALVSEVGQGILPTGRTASLVDLLANGLGAALGIVLHRRRHAGVGGDVGQIRAEIPARG